jgi:hypothetical protein
MGFIAAAFTWLVGSTIGAFVARAVLGYAIGNVMASRAEKKQAASSEAKMAARAVMVNKNSNNDPLPILYGKSRLGGTRAYVDTSNGSGDLAGDEYLNIVLAMTEGEVGDIKQLWFNDLVVWDIDNGGTFTNGGLSGFISTYAPALTNGDIILHSGADNQTVDTTLKNSIGASVWTNNHRLQGVAYIAFKLKADPDIFKGGVPLITAVVEGKKMQNVSNIFAGATIPSTLFSSADANPVDVLYDYLTNVKFGKGLEHDSNGNYLAGLHVDLASFKAAKIKTFNFFKINGVVPTSQPIYDNINEILESMNGVLAFQAGKYTLRIKHANEPTTMVINSSNILTSVMVSMPEKSGKFNKITANYRNPSAGTDYNDDLVVVENTTYLAEDNASMLEATVVFGLVSDTTLVTALATYAMNVSRYGIGVTFEGAHSLLRIEAGDIIEMDLPNFGWTTKKFRVMGLELTQDNTVAITAVEYIPSIELV